MIGEPDVVVRVKPSIRLRHRMVTNPDFSGFNFYVESGTWFDADAYAEASYCFNDQLDNDSVLQVRVAALCLNNGEWLEVTHEVISG